MLLLLLLLSSLLLMLLRISPNNNLLLRSPSPRTHTHTRTHTRTHTHAHDHHPKRIPTTTTTPLARPRPTTDRGAWDAIHIVDVSETGEAGSGSYRYQLTTTLILTMGVKGDTVGACDWSSNICRQSKSTFTFPNKKNDGPMDREHLVQIGKLIEAAEINLRSNVKEVGYFFYLICHCFLSLCL